LKILFGGNSVTGNKVTSLSAPLLARKAGGVILVILAILTVCIISLMGVLLVWSYPGKPEPFVDKDERALPGSISEKIYVDINGVQQGMIIKSKDRTRPVLLYLHGGMPDYFLTEKYPTGLEDYFTVCWWEQRGSGISYDNNIPLKTVTVDQLICDTLEVTNYLRKRFGKEKIYLMGHSGGTFIGVQAAARVPELYYAYIGVAQISNQRKSEKMAYDYMLKEFKANRNVKMVRKLEAAPVPITGSVPDKFLVVRDEAMHSLGIGTTHDMRSVIKGIFLGSLQNREYTLGEKFKTWHAKISSGVSIFWNTVMVTDLAKQVPKLDIPVYFFEGIYDYTCNYNLTKEYFGKLKAPIKGFYTFKKSAHSPIFEEPEKVRHILQEDVLIGRNKLADMK
jgi:pimeloyl-ACP methyl ester carboxylesterase